MDLTPTTFVQIEGTTIRYNVNNLAEAKIALRELKLKKREYAAMKREVADRQKAVRAAYTDEVRTRGSLVHGGGGIGRFVRAIQSSSRDAKRAALASNLRPLEHEKAQLQAMTNAIDALIVRLEAQIPALR